jgi:hypothetical protein
MAGVEIGGPTPSGELWLRGRSADDLLSRTLLTLPATARYAWLSDGRLQPRGAVLAAEYLPAIEWQPLNTWLRFTAPVARLPADVPPPLQLELVPGHEARLANAALVPLEPLLAWMLEAPALRLAPLRFAASSTGRGLVLGSPLPALSCRACYNDEGVVVPAGLAWKPAVSALVVRRLVHAPNGAVVFWDETGAHVLDAELFVAASRSAARATGAALTARLSP